MDELRETDQLVFAHLVRLVGCLGLGSGLGWGGGNGLVGQIVEFQVASCAWTASLQLSRRALAASARPMLSWDDRRLRRVTREAKASFKAAWAANLPGCTDQMEGQLAWVLWVLLGFLHRCPP